MQVIKATADRSASAASEDDHAWGAIATQGCEPVVPVLEANQSSSPNKRTRASGTSPARNPGLANPTRLATFFNDVLVEPFTASPYERGVPDKLWSAETDPALAHPAGHVKVLPTGASGHHPTCRNTPSAMTQRQAWPSGSDTPSTTHI